MSKPTTPYQRGIIRRYYENRDDLMAQKLSETVSDLYLCDSPAAADRLWKSARSALENLGAPPGKIDACISERDIRMLAQIVEELF